MLRRSIAGRGFMARNLCLTQTLVLQYCQIQRMLPIVRHNYGIVSGTLMKLRIKLFIFNCTCLMFTSLNVTQNRNQSIGLYQFPGGAVTSPQAGWLKRTEINFLWIWKEESEIHVSQDSALTEGVREEHFLASSHFWRLLAVHGSICPALPSLPRGLSSLSVSVSPWPSMKTHSWIQDLSGFDIICELYDVIYMLNRFSRV